MAKKTKDTANKLDAFTFHGLEFETKGNQAQGTCPFCSGGKFYVNVKTGQYDCKHGCPSGNVYSFLQRFHAKRLAETEKAHLEGLADIRGLTAKVYKQYDVAYDVDKDRWLIPQYNRENKLVNLCVSFESNDGFMTWGTSGCSSSLFMLDRLKEAGPIYLCEGFYKAAALEWLLTKNDVSSVSVLGVPGANTFKRDWLEHFKGREVVLVYDNNTAGQEGCRKAMDLLKGTAKAIRFCKWPADSDIFPDDYDIRKYVNDRVDKPKAAWRDLQALIVDGMEAIKPKRTLKRETFESVVKDFCKVIHMTDASRDALLVVLATVFSVRIPGDAVWLFLVGPPGSGKSLLIQSLGYDGDHCVFISKLSATALVSGYKGVGDDGSDPSLLPKLADKCLCVKDYTAIKAMPISVQEELYGILRDAYDRNVSIQFGNGRHAHYTDINFSMVAGVTDVIHGDNRATLGERFLKFELLDPDHKPEQQIRSAIGNVVKLVQGDELLRDSVAAFLDKPMDLEKLPTLPEWVENRIIALVQIAAFLRTAVSRLHGDMQYRPRPEVGTRLAKQLVKLGQSIAFVLNKKTVDKEVYRLLEKVTFDTVVGWSLEVVQHIQQNEDGEGVSINEIASGLQVSYSFIQKKINDLQELGIVYNTQKSNDGPGRPQLLWHLTKDFSRLWDAANITTTKTTKPPLKRKKKKVKVKVATRKRKKVRR